MVRHIENLWHSQNSLLSHFQAFSGTFSNMQPYSGILSDIKVGLPPSKNNYFIYFNDSPLKWMKMVLLNLKSTFHSQDFKIFVLNFWSCRKNNVIRKISLISKFMTSQPGKQTTAIHLLLNISRNKGNQTINLFLQISCRKWSRETSSRPLFLF